MPQAVWTGSLSFGLVTIPIRLYPATEPKDVRFHMVDAQGRRVRYRRFVEESLDAEDAETGEPSADAGTLAREPRDTVPDPTEEPEIDAPDEPERSGARTSGEISYDELRRGYETDRGMVVLDREELEAVRPERSRIIEIEDFVDLDDVDPVFFEKSYVVSPYRDAERPYALLIRAMERAGRVGIGRFVLRTKPHLVAIRPAAGVLALETLFFGDEVRDPRAMVPNLDSVDVSERELDLAERLIATLHAEWDPTAYADTYREELLRRIAEKEPLPDTDAHEESFAAPLAGARVDQLMEALKASVEQAKGRPKGRSGRQRTA